MIKGWIWGDERLEGMKGNIMGFEKGIVQLYL